MAAAAAGILLCAGIDVPLSNLQRVGPMKLAKTLIE
jgi:hypothetical protein